MAPYIQMGGKLLYKHLTLLISLPDSHTQCALIFDNAGLREYRGTTMKLLLLMSLRNRLPRSLHLLLLVIRKIILQKKTVVSGKVKGTGKRSGGKPMLEKDNLLFSSSMSTGLFIYYIAHI